MHSKFIIPDLQNQFEHIRCIAAQAGKKAPTMDTYTPFAELRDSMIKAIAALDSIESMPDAVLDSLIGKGGAQ